jgi:hypothetical protein
MWHCMVIKCVIGGLLVTIFNKVQMGQKVLSRPSADSFAVGRRQKCDPTISGRLKLPFCFRVREHIC